MVRQAGSGVERTGVGRGDRSDPDSRRATVTTIVRVRGCSQEKPFPKDHRVVVLVRRQGRAIPCSKSKEFVVQTPGGS